MQEHLDIGALRELRGVLGDEFNVLVSTYIVDSQTRLTAMRTAVATGDAGALREAAHSMKGSSLNLGAGPLAALCKAAEDCGRAGNLAPASGVVDEIAAEFRLVSALLAGGQAGT